MGHLGDTMIGTLYRCKDTYKVYVITEAMQGHGGIHVLLECTHEPYDRIGLHSSFLEDIFTPITTEDS